MVFGNDDGLMDEVGDSDRLLGQFGDFEGLVDELGDADGVVGDLDWLMDGHDVSSDLELWDGDLTFGDGDVVNSDGVALPGSFFLLDVLGWFKNYPPNYGD